MKKLGLILAFLLMVSCQQEKTGYLNTVELMEDYQERKDAEESFNIKKQAFEKKRDSITQAFQLEAQAFQTKSQKMSPQKAQEEYAIFQQRAQFIGQQLQQEEQLMQTQGQTEIDSLVSKVKKHIKAYGKANGLSLIHI